MGQQQIFIFFLPLGDNDGTVITDKASNLQSVLLVVRDAEIWHI